LKQTLRSPAHRALIQAVKEAREALGLSQREFAEKMGESNNFVWRVEAGERRVDIVEFIKLAKALEVDPIALFRRIVR
jgi:transcriptional regulator with XRE-family HTH domain